MTNFTRKQLEDVLKIEQLTPNELIERLFERLRCTYAVHYGSTHSVLYTEAILAFNFIYATSETEFTSLQELYECCYDWYKALTQALDEAWGKYNPAIQPEQREQQLETWVLSWAKAKYVPLPKLLTNFLLKVELLHNKDTIKYLLAEKRPVTKCFGLFKTTKPIKEFDLNEVINSHLCNNENSDAAQP